MSSYTSNCRDYYLKNRERIIQINKEYIKQRRMTDSEFRLRNKIYSQNYNKNQIYRQLMKKNKKKEKEDKKDEIQKEDKKDTIQKLKNNLIVIKISTKKEDLIVYI